MLKPLKEYFDILLMFASNSFDTIDENSNVNLEKLNQLIKAGYISAEISETKDWLIFNHVCITPSGLNILFEWSLLIEKNSIKGNLLDVFGKIIWLSVGAFITILSTLMLKLIE